MQDTAADFRGQAVREIDWAAITKYHRLGGSQSRNVSLVVLELEAKIRMPAQSDEAPLLGHSFLGTSFGRGLGNFVGLL